MENSHNSVIRGGPENPSGSPAQQPERPRGSLPAGGTLNIGGIIGRTFETLMKNPTVFFGLVFSVMIPPVVLGALIPPESPFSFIINFVEVVLAFIVQGSIAYAVYQVMRGGAVNIADAVSRGTAALLPLVLTSFLATLGMTAGLMLFIIPGLVLMCVWFVAIPACVVEKTGPIASLRRSSFLTRGFRWRIFALVLLTSILILALVSAATLLLLSLTGNHVIAMLVGGVIGMVPQAFASVLYAIVYYDLRVIKEGVSLENLTSAFA